MDGSKSGKLTQLRPLSENQEQIFLKINKNSPCKIIIFFFNILVQINPVKTTL